MNIMCLSKSCTRIYPCWLWLSIQLFNKSFIFCPAINIHCSTFTGWNQIVFKNLYRHEVQKIWMQMHNAKFHAPNPIMLLGWQETKLCVAPVWMNLPSVPSACIELFTCGCKTKYCSVKCTINPGRLACSSAHANHLGVLTPSASMMKALIKE